MRLKPSYIGRRISRMKNKMVRKGRIYILTFLYNLIQVRSPLLSVYWRPKNHTSRSPMVFTTWSNSCFPVVVCWMANSSSASIVVTLSFIFAAHANKMTPLEIMRVEERHPVERDDTRIRLVHNNYRFYVSGANKFVLSSFSLVLLFLETYTWKIYYRK